MADLGKLTRAAIVKALRENVPMVALVPAARIYGPEPPATPPWPWAYCASPIESPYRATCMNGAQCSVTLHGFAKGPGDDAASAIGSAMRYALDGLQFPVDSGYAEVAWEQTQLLRDGAEASAWHVVVRVAVEVVV